MDVGIPKVIVLYPNRKFRIYLIQCRAAVYRWIWEISGPVGVRKALAVAVIVIEKVLWQVFLLTKKELLQEPRCRVR